MHAATDFPSPESPPRRFDVVALGEFTGARLAALAAVPAPVLARWNAAPPVPPDGFAPDYLLLALNILLLWLAAWRVHRLAGRLFGARVALNHKSPYLLEVGNVLDAAQDRKVVQERFSGLTHDVTLQFFTQTIGAPEGVIIAKQILDEVVELHAAHGVHGGQGRRDTHTRQQEQQQTDQQPPDSHADTGRQLQEPGVQEGQCGRHGQQYRAQVQEIHMTPNRFAP